MSEPAYDLQAILALSTAVNSTLELPEICATACRIACERLGVDHSTFVLFDATGDAGRVIASYPPIVGALGMEIPLNAVKEEEALTRRREVIEVSNVDGLNEGIFKRNLKKLGVRSALMVPVVGKQGLLGSFSLDAIAEKRTFTQGEQRFCEVFAAQIAVAIENARAYQALHQRASQLEALRIASLAVMTDLERNTVLQRILAQALELLKARTCEIGRAHV